MLITAACKDVFDNPKKEIIVGGGMLLLVGDSLETSNGQ